MVRNSKTTWNKSGKGGHTCLVPDLRGNAYSFSLLSVTLAMVCHIWFLLCCGDFYLFIYVCMQVSHMGIQVFQQAFFDKTMLSPLNCLFTFLEIINLPGFHFWVR